MNNQHLAVLRFFATHSFSFRWKESDGRVAWYKLEDVHTMTYSLFTSSHYHSRPSINKLGVNSLLVVSPYRLLIQDLGQYTRVVHYQIYVTHSTGFRLLIQKWLSNRLLIHVLILI